MKQHNALEQKTKRNSKLTSTTNTSNNTAHTKRSTESKAATHKQKAKDNGQQIK